MIGDLLAGRGIEDPESRLGLEAEEFVVLSPFGRNLDGQLTGFRERRGERVRHDDTRFVCSGLSLDSAGDELQGLIRLRVGNLEALRETIFHVLVNLIDAASADRIVRMIQEQPAPCGLKILGRVGHSEPGGGQHGKRLGPLTEQVLAIRVLLLDPHAA